ncbi:variable surface protein [Plasmodium gonderi]|uniref:Variable surface protein n=1 Tax=Plasmodium gonderi TaxID=77519 RepID=A0A1Y1JP28_PLAGO|nr:variable surface protein [Plasmodium gonderi]GAW84336.1 variable surface protein [Plasmodium gonderi]
MKYNKIIDIDTSEFPSKKFYDILNIDARKYGDKAIYCTYNQEYLNKDKISQLLCSKFIKYILNKDTIWNEKHYDGKRCNLLSYWLYEQLETRFKSSPDVSKNIYRIIVDIWEKVPTVFRKPNYKICHIDNKMNFYHDWKNVKELYDYYTDFYVIKNKSDSDKNECKKYYKYIEKKEHLYNHFKELCETDHSDKCPNFYEDSKKYHPTNVLHKLKCHEETGNEDDVTRALEEHKDSMHSYEFENTHYVAEYIPVTDHEGDYLSDSTSKTTKYSQESQFLIHNYTALKIFSTVFFGTLMIFILFVLSYKVNIKLIITNKFYQLTPIHHILRHKFRMIKNMINNVNEGDNSTLKYTPVTLNPYSDHLDGHYIIRYFS